MDLSVITVNEWIGLIFGTLLFILGVLNLPYLLAPKDSKAKKRLTGNAPRLIITLGGAFIAFVALASVIN